MPALWVLAVLALLLTLLLAMPLRVLFSARNGELSVQIRAGFVRVRLFPPPERKPEKEKPKKPPSEKQKKPAQKQSAERILKTVQRLWEPVTAVLRRIQGAVKIDPLEIRVTYAGRDEPADAAILCGDTLALVWAVMPTLEQLCRIPRPRITVDVNFDASATQVKADAGLTMRVWVLLSCLAPLLGVLRGYRKKPKAERAA
ncbi:MAG: DUF2953 domain-containing protein [Oscillibacter sp.]|nr:DUF2953 domain-containing protein [Oscillibacter sp.]